MAKLTKVQAARQLGISRTTLYKLIDQGKVSASADGFIDETELVRAAPYVDTLREHARTRVDTVDSGTIGTQPGSGEHEYRVHEHVHEHVRTRAHEQTWTGVDTLVDILREQLQRAQERERVYEERERAYQEHIAHLTTMLDQAHQQNQRLLDMPRPTAQDAPHAPQTPRRIRSHPPRQDTPTALPDAPGTDQRGAMRRRILGLLQNHPEGLTPQEMQDLLGSERSLVDTCQGMLRYGLLQRVERGKYIATEPAHTTEPHRS
jgi:hypothetical protein